MLQVTKQISFHLKLHFEIYHLDMKKTTLEVARLFYNSYIVYTTVSCAEQYQTLNYLTIYLNHPQMLVVAYMWTFHE